MGPGGIYNYLILNTTFALNQILLLLLKSMVVNPPPNFCKYFYIKKYASIFSHLKSNFAAITHSLNQGQNFLHIYFYTLVDPFYEVTVSANEL